MPTLAATLSLNVPAITGLLAGVTIPAVTNNLSSTQFFYGQTALTNLTANSANWQSAYTTLSANSANWNQQISNLYSSLATSVQPYSGTWNQTTATLSANSASWVGTYTTLNSNSGGWNATSTCVSQNAGIWGGASSSTAVVAANSANWGNASTTVQTYSGAWDLSIIGSVTAKGPYTVINASTIIPISGLPFGYGGNYNVTLGGLNNTNSGCYNVLVGGNRNYLSAGCYNFIGNGGYNRIGGFNTSTVCNNITLRDNGLTYNNAAVLSGNGSCTRIFDAQGGNFSSSVLVGDTIGIAYTTTSSPSLSSVTTATIFTSGVVVAVNPTDSNQCYGSIVISGRDLSTCTGNGVSARGLYLYDITYNNSCIGSTVVGGNLNTASGNYSTVGGGSYNTALSSSTVAGGCTNFAANNSFIGGGTGNFACNPYSVITAGGFNKIGGGCIVSSTSVLSSNNSCTLVCFANAVCTNNFSNYDPINIVCVGSNGLAAATITQATVVGKNLNTNSTTSLSSIVITGNLSAANSIWIVDKNTSSTNKFNTVGGGALNTASGCYSVVAGGFNNSATGNGSFIAGGTGNTASGNCTFIIGNGINGTASNTVYANNICSQGNVFASGQICASSSSGLYSNNLLLKGDGTNAYVLPTNASSNLYLGANNSTIATINGTTGNVGIGTTVPNNTLTVIGNVSASGGLSASNVTLGSSTVATSFNTSPLTIIGAANGSIFNSIQNTVAGVSASTDVSLYNNDGVNYLDLGIASTSYNGNLYSPVFNVVNSGDSYVYATNNNLVMGAAGAYGNITFFTGGTLSGSQGNERMKITSSGSILAGNSMYLGSSLILSPDQGVTRCAVINPAATSFLAGGGLSVNTPTSIATLTVNGNIWSNNNINICSNTVGTGYGIYGSSGNYSVCLAGSGGGNDNGRLQLFCNGSLGANIVSCGTSYFCGGNVGIGTSTPGANLTVNGTISAAALTVNGTISAAALTVNGTISAGNTVIGDGAWYNSNYTGVSGDGVIIDYQQGSPGLGRISVGNGTGADSLAFYSNGPGLSNPTTTMYLSSNGYVGINTSIPNQVLTVNGNISATGNLYINNGVGNISALGIPQYTYLNGNAPSNIGPAITYYFGTNPTDLLVGNGTYEVEYHMYFVKTTNGTITCQLSSATNLNGGFEIITNNSASQQTATTGSLGNTTFGNNTNPVILNAYGPFANGYYGTIILKGIVQNVSSSSTNMGIVLTQGAGSLLPLGYSYRKITRIS